MPTLKKIIVSDFRNISFAELTPSPGLNCICGDNGQGKTNLLDAIYYLSMTKSAFASTDKFCFRHGTEAFSISGSYTMPDGLESRFVATSHASGSRTFKRDNKPYQRVSAHIGVLPIVMIAPQDTMLVSEAGEDRRRFINAVLSQMDPQYLSVLQRYNHAITSRNRLLKDACPDESLISVLNIQLASCVEPLVRAREAFSKELTVRVKERYSMLCGGVEEVDVSYTTDMLEKGEGDSTLLRDFVSMLESSRARDGVMRYTTVGLQRDDFLFTIGGHPIRKCGSQGQQKSFLVALKLAQYDIMKEKYGFPPILLLDDVFDKLDSSRIANLLKIVSRNDYGQIFITDTNQARLETVASGIAPDAAYFNAKDGEFQTGKNPEI